ncbi:zinc ribbon domain-containing protein [candidate division TA06 bacterium]|nr:zinc ribbon domain-containing protein [candidate division TA06 bacterium]
MKNGKVILVGLLTVSLFTAFSTAVFAQKAKEVILCSTCGYENPVTNKFCVKDGTRLQVAKKKMKVKKRKVLRVTEKPAMFPKKVVRKERKKYGLSALTQPINPSRLFVVPNGDVLGSLHMSVSGGGAFGVEGERAFLGYIGFGLGDVSEVELSSSQVLSNLKEGSTILPTASFKTRLWKETKRIPAVSLALRASRWHEEEVMQDTLRIRYRTRLADGYVSASKGVGSVRGHLGLKVTDVRLENPLQSNKVETQKNLYTPFVGIEIASNPRTKIMFEVAGIPSYTFDTDTTGNTKVKDEISNVWVSLFGVRFFFTPWLSTDAGVKYQSNFKGLADAVLSFGFNANIPFPKLFETRPINE